MSSTTNGFDVTCLCLYDVHSPWLICASYVVTFIHALLILVNIVDQVWASGAAVCITAINTIRQYGMLTPSFTLQYSLSTYCVLGGRKK